MILVSIKTEHLAQPTILEYPRHPQTHHYTVSVTDKRQRQRRTEEQTRSGLQDKLLRLPRLLHQRDWKKPQNKTDLTKVNDQER